MPIRKYLLAPLGCAFALIGACGKPPEEICATTVPQKGFALLFFDGAARRIDANMQGNPGFDWKGIKSSLQAMKVDNLFSVTNIVFKGRNKETKQISCAAIVEIHLPDKYKQENFVSFAQVVKDPFIPGDLFGDHPQVPIDFTIQPLADGKDQSISTDSIAPLAASLVALAVAKNVYDPPPRQATEVAKKSHERSKQ